MSLYRTSGVVLRNRKLGEADKVVILYTENAGKVAASARGARRTRNRLMPVTQPFIHGNYLFFARTGLDVLSQGEIIASNRKLREDLALMAYATYFAELVDQLVEEKDPNDAVFSLLLVGLYLLNEGTVNLEIARHFFEMRLVSVLGYEPMLYECAVCGKCSGKLGGFDIENGGICCTACSGGQVFRISGETLRVLRELLTGRVNMLKDLKVSDQVLAQVEQVMTAYIEYRLPRPLRSTAFLKQVTGK